MALYSSQEKIFKIPSQISLDNRRLFLSTKVLPKERLNSWNASTVFPYRNLHPSNNVGQQYLFEAGVTNLIPDIPLVAPGFIYCVPLLMKDDAGHEYFSHVLPDRLPHKIDKYGKNGLQRFAWHCRESGIRIISADMILALLRGEDRSEFDIENINVTHKFITTFLGVHEENIQLYEIPHPSVYFGTYFPAYDIQVADNEVCAFHDMKENGFVVPIK
jgi:hypothetical protein